MVIDYKFKEARRLSFQEAMGLYLKGYTVQCRMLDLWNNVIEVENYNISEGMDIALEFNEIIKGHWFLWDERN